MCSRSSRRSRRTRCSGPCCRSNGSRASTAACSRAAASRCSMGRSVSSATAKSSAMSWCTTGRTASASWRKLVRSTAWRACRSAKAPRNAAMSSGPRRRTASGTLYTAPCGSSCQANQRRCWAWDSTGSACGSAASGRLRAGCCIASRTAAAKPARSAASNSAASDSDTPSRSRRRASTCTAPMELPPRAKKRSSRYSPAMPSTSLQVCATSCSVSSRGSSPLRVASSPARCRWKQASSPRSSRMRQAERCSLPLEVRGSSPGSSRAIQAVPCWQVSNTTRSISAQSWAASIFLCVARPISTAMPMPSAPWCSTAKAITRPLRAPSTEYSTARSRSCG
ncbi:hypothetical protein D3C76_812390 [compost metagenome]